MGITCADIWFVYPSKEDASSSYDWIKETASNLNTQVDIFYNNEIIITSNNKIFIDNRELNLPKVVFLRGYFEKLALFLSNNNVRVINSYESMNMTQDKFMTNYILAQNNIPTPVTIFGNSLTYEEAAKCFNNKSLVVKANRGSRGEGVYLIGCKEEYDNAIHILEKDVIIQEAIISSLGKDLRVYVLNGRILGAVKRTSNTSDFRANVTLGATVELYECDQELEEICLKVSALFELDFCGIDILFDKESYSVCEVNGNAAFRGISKVSNIDMMNELVSYALYLINER